MAEVGEVRGHHVVNMTDCGRLSLCGVRDVGAFDESVVILTTLCGMLTVEGEGLHISRLDLDKGECEVSGNVTALIYTKAKERGGFFARRAKDR